jgi:hypothetical protein
MKIETRLDVVLIIDGPRCIGAIVSAGLRTMLDMCITRGALTVLTVQNRYS